MPFANPIRLANKSWTLCPSRLGMVPLFFALIAFSLFTNLASSTANAQVDAEKVDFAKDVKPIFEKHCLRCHGADEQDGDFRIDDPDALSDYIDAGEAEFSDLMGMITGESDDYSQMPPLDDGGPMPDEDIQTIRVWINQGAEWPENVSLEMPSEEEQQEQQEERQEKMAEKDAEDSPWQLLWEIAGLLHPVVLHFPVALLIGGAMFALFGFRGESPMSDAAYYCLWLAAWTGILACVSGWSFAVYKGYLNWNSFDIPDTSIDVHRWGGILVATLTFILALIASGSRRRDPYGTGAFWKLSLMLLAVLTGYVAHHGGKLTHPGLHDALNSKAQTLYENVSGENAADVDEKKDDKAKDDKDDEVKDGQSGDDKAAESNDKSSADDKKADDEAKKGSVDAAGGNAVQADEDN